MDLCCQMFISMLFITVGEGLVGLLFNQNYQIWDYRTLPLSFFYNQCNLFFSSIWFLFSFFLIIVDDIIGYYLLKTDMIQPYYKIMKSIIFKLPERTNK